MEELLDSSNSMWLERNQWRDLPTSWDLVSKFNSFSWVKHTVCQVNRHAKGIGEESNPKKGFFKYLFAQTGLFGVGYCLAKPTQCEGYSSFLGGLELVSQWLLTNFTAWTTRCVLFYLSRINDNTKALFLQRKKSVFSRDAITQELENEKTQRDDSSGVECAKGRR
jgi:hypothetical protein